MKRTTKKTTHPRGGVRVNVRTEGTRSDFINPRTEGTRMSAEKGPYGDEIMATIRTGKTLAGNLRSAGALPARVESMDEMIADSRYDRDLINLDAADREELAKSMKAKEIEKMKAAAANAVPYRLSIYIKGMPGSFQYHVGTFDQAMEHFAAITERGYRRVNDRKQLVWYAPAQIESIKIDGAGLDSNNPDRFVRT